MANKEIAICLPKGDAMEPLGAFLETIGFPILEYHSKNRTYRPEVDIGDVAVRAKIMAEKDVAIQVGVGNYDIGFCGLDWIREHTVRYRSARLIVYKSMGMNKKQVHACTGLSGNLRGIDDLRAAADPITIVSEYPNMAENFAIRNRLPRFRIFSAWGSVEAYPPEHADVVLLSVSNPADLSQMGLLGINCELESELVMILNRKSLVEKQISPVLEYFSKTENGHGRHS